MEIRWPRMAGEASLLLLPLAVCLSVWRGPATGIGAPGAEAACGRDGRGAAAESAVRRALRSVAARTDAASAGHWPSSCGSESRQDRGESPHPGSPPGVVALGTWRLVKAR